MTTATLFVHWKQGDDLSACLGEEKGNSHKALLRWAQQLILAAVQVTELASIFEGKELKIDADSHCIEISGDPGAVGEALKKEILSAENPEEDFDDHVV